ncbi:MAG TPA: tetratricopeptide repeat protein [Pseudolabrys sp.]
MPKIKLKAPQAKANHELLFAVELVRQCRLDDAESYLLNILKAQRRNWHVLHLLAEIHLARSDYVKALEFMAAAMKANPDSTETQCNYGYILQKLERHDDALIYFKRALIEAPNNVSTLLNCGTSLYQLNRLTEALANFDGVLALEPKNVNALYNRANVLCELRRFDESFAAFAATLVQDPMHAGAHWNEGLARLLLGDFETGWEKYEWRWRAEGQKHQQRDFAQALWLGNEPLTGKTILVHAEQGYGDTLQFVRYLPRLAEQGAKVVLEVQPNLYSLLTGAKGASLVIPKGASLPPFDLHCPVMSLPLAFKTSLDSIPSDIPYIEAPNERLQLWQERLPPKRGLRVALAWAGSAIHKRDQARSIPLAKLQTLFQNNNARNNDAQSNDTIEWLSVQRDLRDGDAEILRLHSRVQQLGAALNDFDDTASVLSLADLVITVDTAVAHLAGALGRPVWVLLPYSPDFRWLLNREDSPWYPSARLFRQPAVGDWDSVIARVQESIVEFSSIVGFS